MCPHLSHVPLPHALGGHVPVIPGVSSLCPGHHAGLPLLPPLPGAWSHTRHGCHRPSGGPRSPWASGALGGEEGRGHLPPGGGAPHLSTPFARSGWYFLQLEKQRQASGARLFTRCAPTRRRVPSTCRVPGIAPSAWSTVPNEADRHAHLQACHAQPAPERGTHRPVSLQPGVLTRPRPCCPPSACLCGSVLTPAPPAFSFLSPVSSPHVPSAAPSLSFTVSAPWVPVGLPYVLSG